MSGLLLCSSKRGSRPYIIIKNEWEIWSLEELSYYLYQNAYDISEEFFSEELLMYLREELQAAELASRLADMKQANRNFIELITAVCEAANYYDKEEMQALKQQLGAFASMSKPERMKCTADSCMQRKRYVQALKRYEAILACKNREKCEEIFLGRVYHNMGTVYARMLLYHEAEEYMNRALSIFSATGEYEEEIQTIKKELLLLAYLAENTRQLETAELPEEERTKLIAEWEEIRASAKTEEGRHEAVIEKWKQEYRTQMS